MDGQTVPPRSAATELAGLLDSPEIGRLIAELGETRWTGRPGYPLRAMVGMALAKSLYSIPTWTKTVALVREHDALREAIGGETPSVFACYRFALASCPAPWTSTASALACSGILGAMASAPDRYIPAAGRRWLTGSYDRTVALTMREGAWRPVVVRAVADELPVGATAVEIGCGTGALSLALAAARTDAEIVGVDGDPGVLARARRKPGARGVRWVEGLADALPLSDHAAQAVLCSLLLHHLTDRGKERALVEAARVLAPEGVLHIADWGAPRGPAAALGARALQLFDGREGPASLLAGALPGLLADAGFTRPRRRGALRTVWGTLELWRASASENGSSPQGSGSS